MNRSDHMPDHLAEATEAYVAKTLHAPLGLRSWSGESDLPPYLRTAYHIMRGDVRERETLWLLAHDELTPRAVEKHIEAIAKSWSGAQVAVFGHLPSYARTRLIDRGVAFVVPGTQLYLPDHGIDFRSRGKRVAYLGDTLRPSTQALLLHVLSEHDSEEPCTATQATESLGYTLMTMSRAVAELEAHGLIETTKVGRSKEFWFSGGRRATWNMALPFLSTPVQRRFTVSEPSLTGSAEECRLAGLSALAAHTMLASPRAQVCALDAETARAIERSAELLAREGTSLLGEDDVRIIEVWSYDPAVLSKGGTVDVLSLYLSLRDDPDERVQAALSTMIEQFSW